MLIDSHCHLDFSEFDGRLPEVLSAARAAGVERVVTISTRVRRFDIYRAIAAEHDGVFFTVGTHPHNAAEESDISAEHITALARDRRCIAIGEAGLDYFYDNSPRLIQHQVFRTHIAAARDSGLPLVIHARDADEDMAAILTDEMSKGEYNAVLHCFSSGAKLAELGLELGFYISFSGILTFKKSDELRRIAASVPRDRLLVETDAPYLAPEPHRGRLNQPAYVAHTAQVLAATLGTGEEEIARITTENFYRLFRKAAAIDVATRQVEP